MKENIEKMDQIINTNGEYFYSSHYLVFKLLFGTEKNQRFLASLLFSIFGGKLEDYDDLRYVDSQNVGESVDEKTIGMDIFVEDKNGRLINLEMQNYLQEGLAERMLYYGFRLIVSQSMKGKSYAELKPAVSIWILNSIAWTNDDQIMHRYIVMEENNLQSLSELVRIISLEPDKIVVDELPNIGSEPPGIEYWLAFLRAQSKEELMAIAEKSMTIEQAWNLMNDYNASFADRLRGMSIFKGKQDIVSLKADVRIAKQEGLEQGLQKGLQQGAQQSKREIAQAMLAEGMDTGTIQRITGL
ncbi:MAG: Rpn family recombination-promoting nuclease/putative transposase, partial [Bifidobacteriaceae bacterium]|nr:Rpn family recombination-promoting nuclease/putative transposase [Bifidobacteriaceae bacterium]